MTQAEFIAGREAAKRFGRSIWWWLIAMIFVGATCSIVWLVGFMCLLPFEKILPEDRTQLFVRSGIFLLLASLTIAAILIGDWVWRLKRGFICRVCHKRFDLRVAETGLCNHCGSRAFDL